MSDFDARAATWDDDPTKVERAQAVADAIVRSVPLTSTMRAMEYGAGTFHGTGFDGHRGFDRGRLGAKAQEAGFATEEFSTAYEIEKKVDGRQQRFPVFLMVARKV